MNEWRLYGALNNSALHFDLWWRSRLPRRLFDFGWRSGSPQAETAFGWRSGLPLR
jgi:hypothetical protein